MQQEEELLKVQDVAERLQVNARTVLRMVERGELDAVRVARSWRFRPRDIEAYLRKQHIGPAIALQDEDWENEDVKVGSANGEPRIPLSHLDLEQKRLEIEKEQWDLETRRFNYILETGQKMIDSSNVDEQTKAKYKAEFIESLLPQLLELGKVRSSERPLIASKQNGRSIHSLEFDKA
jgi:excisionase family DNA binding protein